MKKIKAILLSLVLMLSMAIYLPAACSSKPDNGGNQTQTGGGDNEGENNGDNEGENEGVQTPENPETPTPPENPELPENPNEVTLTAEYSVMSFNIRTDVDGGNKAWAYRGQYVIDHIKNYGADVVALQEVKRSQYVTIKAELSSKYQTVFYERDNASDPEGLAILFTYEFEVVEKSVFWLSETPETPSIGWDAQYHRICVNTLLRSCYGNYINVYNTHLEWAGTNARNNGLQLIVDRAKASLHPTVICGDFNADEHSNTYGVIKNDFNDTQKIAPETDSGFTAHDWGLFDPEWKNPIDFIFVSKDIGCSKFDILQDEISDGVYYSDHYAVTAKINYQYTLKYVK